MENIDNIMLAIFVFIMIVTVLALYACSVFVKNLSAYEPEEWQLLGSPKSVFINKHGGNLLNYITTAGYKKLSDQNVVSSGDLARILLYVHSGIFICLVFALIAKALIM